MLKTDERLLILTKRLKRKTSFCCVVKNSLSYTFCQVEDNILVFKVQVHDSWRAVKSCLVKPRL